MSDFLNNLLSWVLTAGVRLVLALLVSFIAWKLSDYFIKKIFSPEKESKLDPTLRSFVKNFALVSAKILIIVIAVTFLGINTSSIVAIIAAAGATIGLALQGGLANLAGGIILVTLRPFKLGDYITAGGNSGTVEEIGLFYTTVVTFDNQEVFIPNGSLTGSAIVNVTAKPIRRVDMSFRVSYDIDIKKVKSILTRIATADERVLSDPAVNVVISQYSDSAIIFTLRMWTNTENYWPLYNDMQETVKEVFDMSDISIPYNQVDVHMK